MSKTTYKILQALCLAALLVTAPTTHAYMLDHNASPEMRQMLEEIDNWLNVDSAYAISHVDKAIDLARAEDCDTALTNCLFQKITYLCLYISPNEALPSLEELKEHMTQTNAAPQFLYDGWFNVIMLARDEGDMALAMEEVHKMLDYADQHQSHYGMATAYCLFAMLYQSSFDTAMENLQNAYEHLDKGGYTTEKYEVYYEMAHIAALHEKPEEILKHTAEMRQSSQSKIAQQTADHLDLQAYMMLDDEEKATEVYRRIEKDWDEDNLNMGSINSALGPMAKYLYMYGNNPEKIKEIFDKVNEENTNMRETILMYYHLARKDYKSAYESLWKVSNMNKQSFIDIQEADLATVNTLYKTQELKAEKQQLEIDKARNQLQRDILIIFILVISLLVAAYVIYSTRKHNRKLKIERDHTEEQRQIAEEQRKIAEEQRQIAEEQRQIAETERNRAVHLNEMKTIFLHNMSHEMRTPLNSIIGFNDLLNNSSVPLDAATRKEMQSHIQFHSQQLMHLLDHVIILTRIDSNDAHPVPQEIAVGQIIEGVCHELEEKLNTGVKLKAQRAINSDAAITSDSEFVTIAIREVLDNAIKFTKTGSITVLCDYDDQDNVVVTVTDTGCGIKPENAESLYNRFEKLGSFEAGFGLGMSCCREILTIIGGEVTLDTSYTAGTRFIITLRNLKS